MKKLAFFVACVGMAAVSSAQSCTPADVGPFGSTFSGAERTRGFWFTAPVDFNICSLEVPDETGFGMMSVEVAKMNGNLPPTAWPVLTNDFVSLARHTDVTSGATIPVDIDILAGEVIIVMGAAGDASIMHNSYGPIGSNAYTSDILGSPVVFARALMQDNLSLSPLHDIAEEPGGTFCRVHMGVQESSGGCYADCDGNGSLNILDYICFGDDFAAGGTYADCDGSGSLNILDYICFGDEFAAGCP